MTRVTLVAKPGCHLCDQARPLLAAECAELGEEWAEASILDDAALAEAYWELIPVVLVDGSPVSRWFFDAAALREALRAPSGRS